jgi:hypothetical protein
MLIEGEAFRLRNKSEVPTSLFSRHRRRREMEEVIDVRDLPEEDIRTIRQFVDFLRERAKAKKEEPKDEEEIVFTVCPLGVKGELTREEIYDYL